jgi:hypothetical protein
MYSLCLGYAVTQLVEALGYKPDDHGFDFLPTPMAALSKTLKLAARVLELRV